MLRIQVRNVVRSIIKDPNYPAEDINQAINTVIDSVNNLGRFRFHQGSSDITLVTNDFQYAIPADVLSPELLVFQPHTSETKILSREDDLIEHFVNGSSVDTGDAPDRYAVWNDEFWFEPIPNATANGKTVRIYTFKDLASLDGDLQESVLPRRYHRSVLAIGAASMIVPDLEVNEGSGKPLRLDRAFSNNLAAMARQEKWDRFQVPKLIRGQRFVDQHTMGHVSDVI